MDIEKFESMLKQIKVLHDKLEIKKLRGNNDYNLFLALLDINDEVHLHSRFIYSLLDPNSLHYQKELFLELFIKACGLENFGLDPQIAKVYKEYENIDIYITDGAKHIILENKINAGDQEAQIKRYIETIQEENYGKADIYVLFLSKKGREPNDYSLSGLKIEGGKILEKNGNEVAKFKAVSYNKEIMEWLDSCLDEAGNLVNLAAVISQYKNVIEKIYGIYKGVQMDQEKISEIMLEKENYKIVSEIVNSAFDKAREKVINNFFVSVSRIIKDKLDGHWEINITKADSKNRYFKPIRIYKKSHCDSGEDLCFCIEFQKQNFMEAWAGFQCIIKKENVDILKQYIANYNPKYCNEWWATGQYLSVGSGDFVKAIVLDDYSAEKFADEMVKMIKDFEDMANQIDILKKQKII